MTSIWSLTSAPPEDVPNHVAKLQEGLIPYLTQFLTSRHPHRGGVMCPFMPKALENDDIFVSLFDANMSVSHLQESLKACIDFFKQRESLGHGAIVIMFAPSADLVKLHQLHVAGKLLCMEKDLMLGLLYRDSSAPSLHSHDYFPLRTPTPTMVIRDLTSQDLQFLTPDHYGTKEKIRFLNSYIKKFSGTEGKRSLMKQVTGAKTLRLRYRAASLTRNLAAFLFGSAVLVFMFKALWG